MITLRNLTLGYGKHTVIQNANYLFPDVFGIALMGASGVGKTTLLKAFAGLLPPISGSVEGFNAKRPTMLFQEDRLLPWKTALQNMTLVSEEKNARRMLTDLGMFSVDAYPDVLSGGMRRRVALARALCYNGDFLLLDEPFKGLDEKTRERAAACVLNAKTPFICATHDRAEAALLNADIIYMEEIVHG